MIPTMCMEMVTTASTTINLEKISHAKPFLAPANSLVNKTSVGENNFSKTNAINEQATRSLNKMAEPIVSLNDHNPKRIDKIAR